jgi:murein L,D-transpeptidase YafK
MHRLRRISILCARLSLYLTAVLVLSGILLRAGLPAAHAGKPPDGAAQIPRGFLMLDSPHALLVEKSTQRLLLYRTGSQGLELIKTYRCSTGKSKGDKTESGDLKTPDGGYFFSALHRDEQLPSKYGVMAFVLDFPNYIDEQKGKGGNGIWLHGLDKPLVANDTQGCVALENDDITDLSRYIRLYDTPILITETIAYAGPDELARDRQEALRLISQWQEAWQGKELEKFIDCYSADRYGSWKLQRLSSTKKSLNARYKFISVDLKQVNILKHGDTIIAGFLQDYESDNFASTGFKKLYLQRNSDTFKIVGEDWIQNNRVNRSVDAAPTEERHICRLLNRWVTAWEQKDIETYMNCYSRKFSSQKMNWQQWKEYKAGINAATRRISVAVAKAAIAVDGVRAAVTYDQHYVSDSHTDQGRKKLQLQKLDGDWKIIGEAWEPL